MDSQGSWSAPSSRVLLGEHARYCHSLDGRPDIVDTHRSCAMRNRPQRSLYRAPQALRGLFHAGDLAQKALLT